MLITKKRIMFIMLVVFLLVAGAADSATNPATTWYLYNTSVSGVTPAGQILQSVNSDLTGWQPTREITTTAAYWYTDTQSGTYTVGNWQFILWTNSPGSSSVVRVEIYKTDATGGGAVLIGGQQLDVNATGGGNHFSTYNYNGIAAVSLANQRLMVKIFKVSGANTTIAYNTNDFATRLLTPPIGTGPTATPTRTATPTPTPVVTSKVLPGKIEAENYNAMSGIDTEATSDTGGGLNVGWIDANDWLDYNVNVQVAGTYRIDYRVASTGTGGRVDFRIGGTTLASTAIPNTGGWQVWATVPANVTLSPGNHTIRLFASGGGWNINWFSGTAVVDTPTPTSPLPTATPTAPPSGKVIPGQIEAESYDAMSGIATEACSEGGLNVGWIEANDWLDYNVTVNSTSTYWAEFRVASSVTTGSFSLRRGSTILANYTVPNTGGWQAWTTVSSSVNLTAGAQTLRILATGSGWNINWLRFGTTAPTTPTPPSGPTPTPSSNFWDRSGIPTARNVMIYKFLNRTNGQYRDDQIYWSFNGVTKTIAEQNYIDMPANSAGRVYFSLGAPPNPANQNAYWDFIEHTISSTTWNGNTTRVDSWCLPLAILLHCKDGYEIELGDSQWLFNTNRETIFNTYRNSVPAEFQQTATLHYPYRIVAPGSTPVFQSGGAYANYYTDYVNQVWALHGLSMAKPNTQEVFGCAGSMGGYPAIAAALNRHTGHLAQSSWGNPANFYLNAPANYYAKFWHTYGINGLAYGFPYDDVADQAAYTSHGNPEYLLIAIGF